MLRAAHEPPLQKLPPMLTHLKDPLLALAKQTGAAILAIYQQAAPYSIQTKSDFSPLTQADLLAHKMLVTGLQSLTPEWPVLSEESPDIDWERRQHWHTYWLIDPLDGTQPFIVHRDEFTINIALIQDHRPVIGLLYVPVTQELYFACEAWGGSYKLDRANQLTQLRVRHWQPGQTHILTSHGARIERINAEFDHLGGHTQEKLSSAWKFARVAEGKADISPRFGDTCEWDTAAGQCILELAGGAILDLHGQPLRYNTQPSLINPHFIALGDVAALKPLVFKTE